MEFGNNLRDLPALTRLMNSGIVQVSALDRRRRDAIIKRSPEKFANLTHDELVNFQSLGIPFRSGHLEEYGSQASPQPGLGSRPGIGKGGVFLLDHLPRKSIGFPPIIVPYLGVEYAGTAGQFYDYPDLMGFNIDELMSGSFGDHSIDEGLGFLQSWLFFGLLSEVIGDDAVLQYHYWYRQDETRNDLVMMSPILPRFLDIFSDRISRKSTAPPWEWWDGIFRIVLAVTEKFSDRFEEEQEDALISSVDEPTSLKVLWSILTLGQILSNVAMKAYKIEDSYVEQWPDSPLLDRRLTARGFCPQEVARLKTLLTMDSLYFLSLMPWGNVENLYTPETDLESKFGDLGVGDKSKGYIEPRSHAGCSMEKCVACEIDPKTYRTAHVISGCSCQFLGPDMTEVCRLLSEGKIPVLVGNKFIDRNGVVSLFFDAVDSEATTGFVAISHVWADGLGNANANEMPQCQLFRIMNLVRDVNGGKESPFWIDTCCVPLDSKHRRKALGLMNKTYKTSARTLVLDATLQMYKFHRAFGAGIRDMEVQKREQLRMGIELEAILRIACSSWTTRLWTLQEGQGPPALHFQFADGELELGRLFQRLASWPFIGTSIVHDVRTFLVRLRPRLRTQQIEGEPPEDPAMLRWPGGGLDGRFIALLHSLEWRNTSRVSDEVICLAAQLDLNVEKFDSEPVEQRMEKLLATVADVPAELLFTHGPRQPRAPFRWAPLSLLNYSNQFSFVPAAKPDTPMGKVTQSGLLVKYPAFVIHRGPMRDTPLIYFLAVELGDAGPDTAPENLRAYGMATAVGKELGRSWKETALDSFCTEQDICVIVGRDKMPGPDATMEGGKMGLVIKTDPVGVRRGLTRGVPVQTVVIFEMPGHAGQREHLDIRTAYKLPEIQFCIG